MNQNRKEKNKSAGRGRGRRKLGERQGKELKRRAGKGARGWRDGTTPFNVGALED